MTDLAKRIKALRKNAGLTQKELGECMDMPFRTILNWERGIREPNCKSLVALEKFFHVTGAYLLGEEDDCVSPNVNTVNESADSLELTDDEKLNLDMYIQLTEKYREHEIEACLKLAKIMKPDGTPKYKHMAKNAEFWNRMEHDLQVILAKLRK